jgi:REP element-mobilizing transposase RayT
MPHWRQDGATYFVTFRLSDSLPENRLRELHGLRAEWERRHPPPRSRDVLEQLARMVFERVEGWLDQGTGSCVLRDDRFAELVAQSLLHFHEERYELGCSVVMANHAHAIVRPLRPGAIELEDIIGNWKSYTARRINAAIGETGDLWQDESYDRIIRNEEHLWKSIQYIGRNPEKVGLPRDSCHLWINPEWERLGWTFEWRRS